MTNELSKMTTQTMASVELVKIINEMREDGQAELAHRTFMEKIKKVLGEGGAQKFLRTYVHPQNGQTYPCYHLPKREAHLMVMSESYKVQAKVYDRWQELEAKQQIAIPQTYIEALEALVVSEKAKLQLAIELDKSKQWYSIKRVAQLNGRGWKEFSWNKLKAAGVVTGYPPRKIFDANYGEVNTYHKAAWDAAYPGPTIEGDAE
jgi:hypothetical protein